MAIKHFLLWLPMIVLAFGNAAIREMLLLKYYTELRAHQFSTITLIIFCSIYVWIIFPQLSLQNAKQAFIVGIIWVLLTVAFEFSLGRLTNKSWNYLLRDYNLFAGRIWLLFIICLFILPYILYYFERNIS